MTVQPEEEITDYTDVKTKDLNREQKRARKAAKAGGYTDRNLDGIPDADQVNWEELDDFAWLEQLINEVPELKGLFDEAVKQGAFLSQTGRNNFVRDFMQSKWFTENDAAARSAFEQRLTDPETYKQNLQDARNAVRQAANEMGAPLDEATLGALAERYIIEGWSDPARSYRMQEALQDKVGPDAQGRMFGDAGNTIDRLRQTAFRNGMEFDAEYYNSAFRSINSGLTDEDFWNRQIREQAASFWPAYSEQIMGGVDVMSLANGYVNLMARTLEIDPNSISLNDPFIRRATTGLDEAGNPRTMPLWEFEQELRNDPRWMNTDQAAKRVTDIGTSILQRFGIL